MAKQKAEKTEVKKQVPVSSSIFDQIGNKAQWLLIGVLALMAIIVFKDFLFLKKIYLFKDIGSDSLNASYPIMMHAKNYMSQYGIPSWSFEYGMGQNSLSYTLYDPFDAFIYLFSKEKLPYLLGYKEAFKIVLTGWIFYHYLRTLKVGQLAAMVGSAMLAFSGFMVVGSGWFIFSFEVLNMALLLLGFEKLYQNKNPWILPIPIFLIGVSRPFNLALYAIFMFVYASFRFLQERQKMEWKPYFMMFLTVIGVAAIGLLASGPMLLEHIHVMLESPRGSGATSYSATLSSGSMFETVDKIQFGTAIQRMLASDMLGSGINFHGWMNILEAPMFYCSLPCLLLVPQVFPGMSRRQKWLFALVLMLWIFPLIFPYFRKAFWFFTGDYYRTYSFFVALILIIYAVLALDRILRERRLHVPTLIASVIVIIGLASYPYFQDKSAVNSGLAMTVKLFLVAYAVLLFFIYKGKTQMLYAFLGLLFIELSYFSWVSVNKRDHVRVADLSQKIGYNDYTVDAVEYLKKNDTTAFYRIDKNYYSSPAMHGSLNDGMAQDYYGSSSYNSFNHKYYIKYLTTMGVIASGDEFGSRWAPGFVTRLMLEGVNSVKYLCVRGNNNPTWKQSHDSIAQFGDVTLLRHKYNLPLGFTYDKVIRLSEVEKMSPTQKDFTSLQAAVINDEDAVALNALPVLATKDSIPAQNFSWDLYKSKTDSLRRETMTITAFAQTHIRGTITTQGPRMLYLSFPYDEQWEIKDASGTVLKKYILSNGMTGLFLDKGQHDLDMTFHSSYAAKGKWLAIVGLLAYIGIVLWRLRKNKQHEKAAA